MLDQETGLRGYALTRSNELLIPFRDGARDFDAALAEVRGVSDGDEEVTLIGSQVAATRRWQSLARDEIAILRADPDRPLDPALAIDRKRVFDRFRAANDRFRERLENKRAAELRRAGWISVAVIIVFGLLFGGLGLLAINRSARSSRAKRDRERAAHESQTEFNETMQIMRDEIEAHELVKRHLERTIPGSSIVVLARNNSKDPLTASTTIPERSPLAPRSPTRTPSPASPCGSPTGTSSRRPSSRCCRASCAARAPTT